MLVKKNILNELVALHLVEKRVSRKFSLQCTPNCQTDVCPYCEMWTAGNKTGDGDATDGNLKYSQ